MESRVIALGFFDGVHRGHSALLYKTIQRAKELNAKPAVFTFDRSPKEFVSGNKVFLINSNDDRKELIHRLFDIDEVIFAPFDEKMMKTSWESFVTNLLVKDLHAVHVVAGHDHRFGHKNAGTPELLQQKCAELGIGCDIIPKVEYDGITVSSTYIRKLVENGCLERAAEFLGHRHCISHDVVHGYQLGRTIGIPTINLAIPENVLLPKPGVYITRVYLPDGSSYPGVTNIGTRPTVSNDTTISVETFLLDFNGDLYDTHIRLDFCRWLRDEKKFDSLDALKEEISHNIISAREYFSEQ